MNAPPLTSGSARRFEGEWRGAAFTGVLALFASAYFWSLDLDGGLRSLRDMDPASYLPPCLMLICVILSYGRYRRYVLPLWFLLSLLGAITLFSTSSWGNGIADAPEIVKLHYYGNTFLSDALFAFGSSVLLAASLGLIWAEWGRRARDG